MGAQGCRRLPGSGRGAPISESRRKRLSSSHHTAGDAGLTAGIAVQVSHELGHAICREEAEAIANRVSAQLRSGVKIDCMSSLTPLDEFYLRTRSHDLRSSYP